jgi:uncharacterized protein (TIGR03435 family)
MRSAIARTVFFSATCVLAQSDRQALVETASVRPHVGPVGQAAWPHILISENRIAATATLGVLVVLAYDLSDEQIPEGPASTPLWNGKFFDVTATSVGMTPGLPQVRRMLREILADHFRLKTHWETETVLAFELAVGQKGPKFKKSSEYARAYGRSIHKEGITYVSETKRSMAQLALILESFIGQPVADKTALTGVYDFTFAFRTPEHDRHDDPASAIAAAVEEHLGLMLIPSKQETQRLVIDHAEWPEN